MTTAMTLHCWGVHGSMPTPEPTTVRSSGKMARVRVALGHGTLLCGRAIHVAQFLAVCSASTLAGGLGISSPFASQSREKRSATQTRTSLLRDELQPSTHDETMSEGAYALPEHRRPPPVPREWRDAWCTLREWPGQRQRGRETRVPAGPWGSRTGDRRGTPARTADTASEAGTG